MEVGFDREVTEREHQRARMTMLSGFHKKVGGYKGFHGGSRGKKYGGGHSKGQELGSHFRKKASSIA